MGCSASILFNMTCKIPPWRSVLAFCQWASAAQVRLFTLCSEETGHILLNLVLFRHQRITGRAALPSKTNPSGMLGALAQCYVTV